MCKANLELRWITVRESKPYRIPRGDIEIKTTPVSPRKNYGACVMISTIHWLVGKFLCLSPDAILTFHVHPRSEKKMFAKFRLLDSFRVGRYLSLFLEKKKILNSISIVEELNNIFEPLKLWKYYIYFLEKCNQDIYLQKVNLLCIFNILNIEIIKKLLHFKYNEIFLSFFSSDLDKCLIERFWYAYAINFII